MWLYNTFEIYKVFIMLAVIVVGVVAMNIVPAFEGSIIYKIYKSW